MVSIQQIQYIVTVSEERQFQRASERCFVTQPTLSMQVKKAEEALGHAIFDRSRSPLELTAYGKELLPVLRDVLNEYARIELLNEQQKGNFKEQVKLAIIPTVAGFMLPDLFDHWLHRLEGVELIIEEMKTEEILVALEEKTIDVGIIAGPVHNPRWRSSVLFQEEIYAFAPEIKSKTISPTDLEAHHPWLLSKGNCLRTQMVHFCELNTQQDDAWNYEGGNLELLVKMVQLNGGYTLVPKHYLNVLNLDRVTRIQEPTTEAFPAREIIALNANRNPKWPSIEKLVRSIQLKYQSKSSDELRLLDWK